jgi:hypothetical protein
MALEFSKNLWPAFSPIGANAYGKRPIVVHNLVDNLTIGENHLRPLSLATMRVRLSGLDGDF